MEYGEFLFNKAQLESNSGFDPVFMPDFLFDYQKSLIEYAVQKGRGAIFADCGLGKTPMELVWAQNIVQKTNGNVLIITALAVGAQMVREAEKFGIEAGRSRDGKPNGKITITNYEMLHLFDANDFIGVACDESSILKSIDGATKKLVTKFLRKIPFRLLATATAAPNDFHELGTSSEALGYLGAMDMLNKFFRNTSNDSKTGTTKGGELVKWVLKTHAHDHFWKWVTSWSRAARSPSDLGFDDGQLKLPKLCEREHMIDFEFIPDGMLFPTVAIGLGEQRQERRRSLEYRCQKVADLVNKTGEPALVWCQMNDEGDMLEKMIPDAVQVAGRHTDDDKEEKLTAFAEGKARVLVTKPKIGAWGLNFQHCNHVTFFPSHSYEQYYQGIRRCWRFGQKRQVNVDIVTTAGEISVLKNLQRKQQQADEMFSRMVQHMNESIGINRSTNGEQQQIIPNWVKG